ncbi:MAG: hypothetical protein QM802_06275 [Agriterribacter sp.]
MTPRLSFIAIAILSWFITGCSSVFVHPMNTGATAYHASLLKRDTINSRLYASGGIGAQMNNGPFRDGGVYGQGNIYNTHRFGMFNAYYGANISVGNYLVNKSSTYHNNAATLYSQYGGNKYFGSWGGSAGINASVPVRKRGKVKGEWRLIGIHGAFQQDWGSYYRFRQIIQPEWVDYVTKSNSLRVIGLSTELVVYKRKPTYSSIQLQYNFLLGREYRFPEYTYTERSQRIGYFSATLYNHSRKNKSFLQLNLGTHDTFSIFWGMNFIIGASRKK